MAKEAYPKIMYCEDAYKRGASDVLAIIRRKCLNLLPDFYARKMVSLIDQMTMKETGNY